MNANAGLFPGAEPPSEPFLPWQEAWERALYGEEGFYRRREGPAGHFRTAAHAAPEALASALTRLAVSAGCSAIVDVGAGRGELLTALSRRPESTEGVLRLHGVDVVSRPDPLPEPVGWSAGIPELLSRHPDVLDGALLVAWELLDVVPCPVLELDDAGTARVVLVDPGTGQEALGGRPTPPQAEWCQRWWPWEDAEPGDRIEVGLPRDTLWAELVHALAVTKRGGLALAVDYSHGRDHRPSSGTLMGFRRGRIIPPVPDRSADITAHVALDSVARAGQQAAERGRLSVSAPVTKASALLTTQARALRQLGVGEASAHAGTLPRSGREVLAALQTRSQEAELLASGGLGGFGWLMQPAGLPVPPEFF